MQRCGAKQRVNNEFQTKGAQTNMEEHMEKNQQLLSVNANC